MHRAIASVLILLFMAFLALHADLSNAQRVYNRCTLTHSVNFCAPLKGDTKK